MVSMSEDLPNFTLPETNFTITIFGVGKTGCHVVDLMQQKYRITDAWFGDYTLNYVVVVGTDAEELKHSDGATKLHFDGTQFKSGDADIVTKGNKQSVQSDSVHFYDLGYIVGDLDEELTTEISLLIATQMHCDGALTLGVVPKPVAENGDLNKVKEAVNSLIVVDCDRFSSEIYFDSRDEVLAQAVMATSEMITHEDGISVDFADISAVMNNHQNFARMGFGIARGENRAKVAVARALEGVLLDNAAPKNCLVAYSCPSDSSMEELDVVAEAVVDRCGDDVVFILGFAIKKLLGAQVSVTIIA